MDCLNNVFGNNGNCACTWLIIAILAILFISCICG